MDLSKDDVLKLIRILDESGYDEVRLEVGDLKLHAQKGAGRGERPAVAQAPASVPATAAAAEPAALRPSAPAPQATAAPAIEELPPGTVAVRAPMLGTFYRAPAPGEKPFVEIGAKVAADDTLCLVEVMKLFNSVKAGIAGRVVRILAENGAMVEHGQMLMLIEED